MPQLATLRAISQLMIFAGWAVMVINAIILLIIFGSFGPMVGFISIFGFLISCIFGLISVCMGQLIVLFIGMHDSAAVVARLLPGMSAQISSVAAQVSAENRAHSQAMQAPSSSPANQTKDDTIKAGAQVAASGIEKPTDNQISDTWKQRLFPHG